MELPTGLEEVIAVSRVAGAPDVLEEVYKRVRSAYGGAIGRHKHEVVTPALLLDLPAARRNIARMAARPTGEAANPATRASSGSHSRAAASAWVTGDGI